MAHDIAESTQASCPACEYDPFTRNAYWTGKLMLARDFIDEQHYMVQKLRHHNQTLHGWGVVCGLKVTQHDKESCRSRFVVIQPGTAVDCCGHDIVVAETDLLDVLAQPQIKALKDSGDTTAHTLQICIRYRECTTEDIPVLYDECGCDDTRCAPNRILESYELGIILDPDPADAPGPVDHCSDLWQQSLEGCPHCDLPDCVVLATIENYVVGNQLVDPPAPSPAPAEGAAVIDNLSGRRLLPSTQAIKAVLDCMLSQPGGDGAGIDAVSATFVDCHQPGSATIQDGPPRTLVLQIPRGCDGADGVNGTNGAGLETGLTQIGALSWAHATASPFAFVTTVDGAQRAAVVIEFTAEVMMDGIDDRHVFQLLVDDPEKLDQGLYCRCAVRGEVIPVKVTARVGKRITKAEQITGSTTPAIAFLLPKNDALMKRLLAKGAELGVALHCDFVLDKQKRAVDGEFVRAQLPSGDRAQGSAYGIQGGLFESWFAVRT